MPPDDASPALPWPPQRPADSHKGDYGLALIMGGSRGMCGAVALAGKAALRSGAGLVRLAVPDRCLELVASFEPSYMTVPLPDDDAGRLTSAAGAAIRRAAELATAVAVGPGLGRSDELTRLTVDLYRQLPQPAVFDADALYALSREPAVLAEPGGPRILTPHVGEFRRLVGQDISDRETLEREAQRRAAEWKIVMILKGHRSFITDGVHAFHNPSGNPGMATCGSGDVLTGVVTALVCQGLAPLDAARLGAYVHGRAGDLGAGQIGQISLTATDLVDWLPEAFRQRGA